MLFWTKKRRQELAQKIEVSEERSRKETMKLFEFYHVIEGLDLSNEVKCDLWKRMINIACDNCLDHLDFKVIRNQLEA